MQNISRLPIDEAMAVFDEVVSDRLRGRTGLNWNPDAVRERLIATAEDGYIETGTAKRIVSSAEEPHRIKMMSTPGTRTIKERWNALKTVMRPEN